MTTEQNAKPATIRALLIDPAAKAVSELTLPAGGMLKALYEAIQCDTVDVVYMDHGLCAYVDDEGLFKPDQDFWRLREWQHDTCIAGRAVVVGDPDEDGNDTDCPIGVDELRERLAFGLPLELILERLTVEAALEGADE